MNSVCEEFPCAYTQGNLISFLKTNATVDNTHSVKKEYMRLLSKEFILFIKGIYSWNSLFFGGLFIRSLIVLSHNIRD